MEFRHCLGSFFLHRGRCFVRSQFLSDLISKVILHLRVVYFPVSCTGPLQVTVGGLVVMMSTQLSCSVLLQCVEATKYNWIFTFFFRQPTKFTLKWPLSSLRFFLIYSSVNILIHHRQIKNNIWGIWKLGFVSQMAANNWIFGVVLNWHMTSSTNAASYFNLKKN